VAQKRRMQVCDCEIFYILSALCGFWSGAEGKVGSIIIIFV